MTCSMGFEGIYALLKSGADRERDSVAKEISSQVTATIGVRIFYLLFPI